MTPRYASTKRPAATPIRSAPASKPTRPPRPLWDNPLSPTDQAILADLLHWGRRWSALCAQQAGDQGGQAA